MKFARKLVFPATFRTRLKSYNELKKHEKRSNAVKFITLHDVTSIVAKREEKKWFRFYSFRRKLRKRRENTETKSEQKKKAPEKKNGCKRNE